MKKIIVPLVACIVVVWFWSSWPRLNPPHFVSTDTTLGARGQYGDSYGSLNTLFTGLALVGLIATLHLQITEQTKRKSEQELDTFEARIFRLIDSLRSLVSGTDVTRKNTPWKGRDAFKAILLELIASGDSSNADQEVLIERYSNIYKKYQDDLGPYFRLLYHALRFIDRTKLQIDKEEYTDLIRAELSSAELSLLIPNALTAKGAKMKPLLEKYHILKHAPTSTFDPKKRLRERFSKSAFQEEG